MSTVTLLVPALNEAEGISQIMPRVDRSWCDQILVVDGRSSDSTVEQSHAQGLEVIVQKRPGLRHAYIEGFRHVRGDYVITFSPDGNSVPELIPELIAKAREGYDMVIASRYLGSARSYDDDAVTRFGNWLFTAAINLLFGARYTDSLVMFRIYRTALFHELGLDRDESYALPERLFNTVLGVEPLLGMRCAKRRLRVAEIPGDEPKRLWGKRKLQIFRWGSAYILQILMELLRWR
jgi:glycosyltransferase involved in cell wall biosynthesis